MRTVKDSPATLSLVGIDGLGYGDKRIGQQLSVWMN